MAGPGAVLGCVKNVGLFVLVLYCCSIIHGVGVNWWNNFNDLDVYTVSDPNFWGPVTMLIPTNCTAYNELMKKKPAHQQAMQLSNKGLESPKVEVSWLGHPILPEGVSRHDFVNLVQVSKCGHNVSTEDITGFQWWAAMVGTAQSSYATIDGLHSSRFHFWWLFVLGFAMTNFTDVYLSCAKLAGEGGPFGGQQLGWIQWILTFGYKKATSYQSQLQICSLFITFWDEDHYVMSYMPGMAYILMIFGTPCIMAGASSSLLGAASGNELPAIVCGCLACLWAFFLLVPLNLVFPFYTLNFLYKAFFDAASMSNYQQVVKSSWPSMTKMAGHTSKAVFGVNCVDLVIEMAIVAMASAGAAAREAAKHTEDGFVRIEDAEVPVIKTAGAQPQAVHPI